MAGKSQIKKRCAAGTDKRAGKTKSSSDEVFDEAVLGRNKNNKTATGLDYSIKIADVAVYHPLFGRRKKDI